MGTRVVIEVMMVTGVDAEVMVVIRVVGKKEMKVTRVAGKELHVTWGSFATSKCLSRLVPLSRGLLQLIWSPATSLFSDSKTYLRKYMYLIVFLFFFLRHLKEQPQKKFMT